MFEKCSINKPKPSQDQQRNNVCVATHSLHLQSDITGISPYGLCNYHSINTSGYFFLLLFFLGTNTLCRKPAQRQTFNYTAFEDTDTGLTLKHTVSARTFVISNYQYPGCAGPVPAWWNTLYQKVIWRAVMRRL